MTIVDMFKSVAVNVSTCDYRDYPWLRDVPCPAFLEHNFVGTYWDFIHWLPNDESQLRAIKIFYDSLSDEMRGMLINARYDRTLMLVDLPFMGHTATERVVDAMNEVVDDRHWIPGGAVSHVTGMAAITLIIDDAVQHVQKWTMIISVMLVFITITLIYRSPRIGGISMIPILVVLAWQPLTMQGLTASGTDATLGMITAMVSSIVVGVGIDFAIHITERVHEEGETARGIAASAEHTGQSLVEATAATSAGLAAGVMVPLFKGFFALIILLLAYSMLTALFVLPAAYAVINRVRSSDLLPPVLDAEEV